MLIQCKKDKEKVAMSLLSYLPDFKNLDNLRDEIKLNKNSEEFRLFLYRDDDPNFVGVMGTQWDNEFIVVQIGRASCRERV